MKSNVDVILNKEALTREDLISLLSADKADTEKIFKKSAEIREREVGNKVYFRGLIEFSNICSKNCYYCGIRSGNKNTDRYILSKQEALSGIQYAFDHDFASIVLQSGEKSDKRFIDTITDILHEIKNLSNGELGVTLSCGEQTEGTYQRWFEAGAHRYLLRIEESNPILYKNLHPNDIKHEYNNRIDALKLLRKTGYQVGTGVMIGLPFQTIEDLADDLLFFKKMDIDMAGMGPYIEHKDTPLYRFKDQLMSKEDRFQLSLKMYALLRILIKDINMAATTALQTLHPKGRELALKIGCNVLMPNLTPLKYRDSYLLYNDKPAINEEAKESHKKLEANIINAGLELGYGVWGDSKHFAKRSFKR